MSVPWGPGVCRAPVPLVQTAGRGWFQGLHMQVAPLAHPPSLPAPRRRARAGTLPVPAGNPIQHRGRRPNKDFYVRQRKREKKKRYLNKTALSLFLALPLLLEGFLFPDGDTPRWGWSTHIAEHPWEIPATGHRDGDHALPPCTECCRPLPSQRGKRWSFAPSSCSVLEELCRKYTLAFPPVGFSHGAAQGHPGAGRAGQ